MTLAILILLCGSALAQFAGLKPGLRKLKPTSQILDVRDRTAQMAPAQEKLQQALAGLSPEQRKQMEAVMGRQGSAPAAGATAT